MKPDAFDLDSANFTRERRPIPAPIQTQFPNRDDGYLGFDKSSDKATFSSF